MVGFVRLERVEAVLMEHALRFVGEQHGVAVEGDAHLVGMRIGARGLRVDERGGETGDQRRADVVGVRGQEQICLQRLEIARTARGRA